jgi:hypothetical protein
LIGVNWKYPGNRIISTVSTEAAELMSGEKGKKTLPSQQNADQVSAFLAKVAATPAVKSAGGRGRLLFGMDATASREPS